MLYNDNSGCKQEILLIRNDFHFFDRNISSTMKLGEWLLNGNTSKQRLFISQRLNAIERDVWGTKCQGIQRFVLDGGPNPVQELSWPTPHLQGRESCTKPFLTVFELGHLPDTQHVMLALMRRAEGLALWLFLHPIFNKLFCQLIQ